VFIGVLTTFHKRIWRWWWWWWWWHTLAYNAKTVP